MGFIGKLFKNTNLPVLIQFFLAFYNTKPVDYLLSDVIQEMACEPPQYGKKCKQLKGQVEILNKDKPSLFQHIGFNSSLKVKVKS